MLMKLKQKKKKNYPRYWCLPIWRGQHVKINCFQWCIWDVKGFRGEYRCSKAIIEYNLWQRSISTYILKEKSTIKTLVCSIFTPHFNFTYSWHFLFLFIYHQFMLIFFAFDNDDMESSKRRVAFFALIFLLNRIKIPSIYSANSMLYPVQISQG